MDFLSLIAGFIVGVIATVYTLGQVALVLFFSIPLTRELNKAGDLKQPNPIQRNNMLSLFLLSGVFVGIAYLVFTYFPGIKTGFLVGGGLSLLAIIGKSGRTPANMADYYENKKEYLKEGSSSIIESIKKDMEDHNKKMDKGRN